MEVPDVGLLIWLDSHLIKDVNGTIKIYPQLTLIVFFQVGKPCCRLPYELQKDMSMWIGKKNNLFTRLQIFFIGWSPQLVVNIV